jgi:hypothetical protein
MDTTTKHPSGLSPEQDFRLRVARNDLQRAHELDLVGASAFEVAQAAGALRASLLNALAIVDNLTGAVMSDAREHICDYCMNSAGSPIARLEPGNVVSPLVGVTHPDCWKRFMDKAQAMAAAASTTAANTAAELAFGHCRHCGRETVGRLVENIDQASGPGWTVIVCPPCEKNPPVVPAAEKPRTYSL